MSEAKEDVEPKWEEETHLEGEDARAVAVCPSLSARITLNHETNVKKIPEGSDIRSKRARAEDVDNREEEKGADEGEREDSVGGRHGHWDRPRVDGQMRRHWSTWKKALRFKFLLSNCYRVSC